MATGIYPAVDGFTGVTETGGMGNGTNIFVPEIWSDEILAAYKKNLVLAPLVRKMSMVGKKGDTIHIPKPTRGNVTAKAEGTAVTIQNSANSLVDILINKHYEYSTLIEDIVEVQAMSSLRRFHTDDAGYALAKQVDDDLFLTGTGFGDGGAIAAGAPTDWAHSNCYFNDAVNGTTLYAQDTVAAADTTSTAAPFDQFFRDMVQKMDDADAPMDNRFFVIPPAMRNTIMGVDRYVSTDFVNNKGVVSGKIGNLYGIDIYVSTNCPEIESAAENLNGSVQVRGAILAHKDTSVLAEQKGIRSQTQYKQEFLGTLFTADRVYGTQVLRPETGFVVAFPN